MKHTRRFLIFAVVLAWMLMPAVSAESTPGMPGQASVPAFAGTEIVSVDTYEALKTAVEQARPGKERVVVPQGQLLLHGTIVVKAGTAITLSGNASLVRAADFCGTDEADTPLFLVEEGARLTIDGITLDGGDVALQAGGHGIAALICCNGQLFMQSGVLTGAIVPGMNSGAVLVSGENAVFEMHGGTITRNHIAAKDVSGTVMVNRAAQFHLYAGSITGNICTAGSTASVTAGVMVVSDYTGTPPNSEALFYMHGGEISENITSGGSRASGGGVYLYGPDWSGEGSWSRYARMVMDGGVICGNSTVYGGGGVFAFGLASFTMNGGRIENNTATAGMGGGVCVYDGLKDQGLNDSEIASYSRAYGLAAFTMNGGAVTENKALKGGPSGDNGCGGGVYIASMNAVLNAGEITGNYAQRQGGGLYVGSTPYVAHLYNALVTENTATILGGGLWLCPTGDATNTVTNGGAIFGNTAASAAAADAAGDDIAVVPQDDKTHTLNLADRMLGGGEVEWYLDGGVKSTQPEGENILGLPDGTPRFDKANPGERQTDIQAYAGGAALKGIASRAAVQLAQSQARLLITGNEAPRGGGIGSNGAVVIGEQEEWTLRVTKAWDGVQPDARKAVTVRLKIGEYVLDAVTLNEENGWCAEFNQLPRPDTLNGLSITVVEEGGEYEASYSRVEAHENEKLLVITITNRPVSPDGPPPVPVPPKSVKENPKTSACGT